MAIVEDDAECGFSHFDEVSPDAHVASVSDDEELALDEELSPDEVVSLDEEPSPPGGERGTKRGARGLRRGVGWMICLTRVGAPPIVSGQWMSLSSASVGFFFSRGKAWTSSAARRVSMVGYVLSDLP